MLYYIGGRIKVCVCGEVFVLKAHSHAQKYCSLDCARNMKKKQRLEFYYKYRETINNRRREYQKGYYQANKTQSKRYYQMHKETIKARSANHRINHLVEVAVYHRKYMRDRKKADANFRLISNLRSGIRAFLNGKNKSFHTMDLVGCTATQLWKHLELQFKPGMTRENWGTGWGTKGMQEWHIDHIRPCASFDPSSVVDQKECWHYTNLQPMWAKDNLRKSKVYKVGGAS